MQRLNSAGIKNASSATLVVEVAELGCLLANVEAMRELSQGEKIAITLDHLTINNTLSRRRSEASARMMRYQRKLKEG